MKKETANLMNQADKPAIIFDDAKQTVESIQKNGKYARVDLTPKERGLVKILASGNVVSRAAALDALWGHNGANIDTRTADQHVSRLRKKLGPVAAESIVTVVGDGYRCESIAVRGVPQMELTIDKIVGQYRMGKPGHLVTAWLPHSETAPKAKAKLRVVEVR